MKIRSITSATTAAAAVLALVVTSTPADAGPVSTAEVEPIATTTPDTAISAPARPLWVPDRTRRDHRSPEYNAQGIWIYPRIEGGWLYIQVKGRTLRPSRKFNGVEVYLHTRGDRRPDYRIVHWLRRDGDGIANTFLNRIRGWESPGSNRSCSGLAAKWRVNARVVEFAIPRRCIHRQGRVKVNAETWDFTRYRDNGMPRRGVYDPVPARHQLSRWY